MILLVRALGLIFAISCQLAAVCAQDVSNSGALVVPDTTLRYHLDPSGVRASIYDVSTGSVTAISTEVAKRRQLAGQPSMVLMSGSVTSWQAVRALTQIETLAGEIEVPPEGGLAPGGYFIEDGEMRWVLIRRMQARQRRNLNEFWEQRARGLPYNSKDDALILASIIEVESSIDEERPVIASVLINRLNQGMRLQLDSTVEYGITEGQDTLNRGPRMSELRSENPYNTYMNEGLPPMPISNPSASSIEAALNPADTDYVFYVRDPNGGYAFAETLEEHNENVQRWRRFEAEQNSENSD